jgi:phosphoribosylaminoimidazolecarboxamide formyltransferase/IMP cyclohydrolase
MAQEISKMHYDAVVAPGFADEAFSLLSEKKSLRLARVAFPEAEDKGLEFRHVRGGLLVQTRDYVDAEELAPKTVSKRAPTTEEMDDLVFAWRAVKAIKSNAITIVKDQVLLGMGAGQPSRVQSVETALKLAGDGAAGAVMASDAFFPFADGPELALNAGVKAIIEPGGSVRDGEVIEAVDKHGVAMVFTGSRHFKH